MHVQTTSYALTAEALGHLISIGFYDNDRMMSKPEVIALYELRLSKEIIKNGWNISCVLPLYDSIDYRSDSYVLENPFAKNFLKGNLENMFAMHWRPSKFYLTFDVLRRVKELPSIDFEISQATFK